MKYRKRPLEVEAIQFTRDNLKEIEKFIDKAIYYVDSIAIKTLEGTMYASPGDYIIKGIDGEFYPCKADVFEKTYDKVLKPITCSGCKYFSPKIGGACNYWDKLMRPEDYCSRGQSK